MPTCFKDCDRSFSTTEAEAVQLGWGCHNGKWLCLVHMAEHDAPAVAAGKLEIERQEAEKELLAKQIAEQSKE